MPRKKQENQIDNISKGTSLNLSEKIDLNALMNEDLDKDFPKIEENNEIIENNDKKSSKKLDKKDSNVVSYNQEDIFSDDNDEFFDERFASLKKTIKNLSDKVVETDEETEDKSNVSEDEDEVEEIVEEKVDNTKKEKSESEYELKEKALKEKELELQQRMELLIKYQQEMLNNNNKKEEVKEIKPSKKELKQQELAQKKEKIKALYNRVLEGDASVIEELVELQTHQDIPEDKEEINVDEVVNQKLSYQLQVMKEEQIKEQFANENKDLLENEDYRDFLISKFNKLKESGADSTLGGLLKLSAEATRKAFKIEKVNHNTESLKEQESIKQELEKKEKAKKLAVKTNASVGVNSDKKVEKQNEEESLLDMYRRYRV